MSDGISVRELIRPKVNIFTTRSWIRREIASYQESWYDFEGDTEAGLEEKIWAAIVSGRLRKATRGDLREVGVERRYLSKTLANFGGLGKLSRSVREDLNQWPLVRLDDEDEAWDLVEKSTLIAFGPTGTGKTHLATGIARRLWEAGLGVWWIDATEFLDRLKASIDTDKNRTKGFGSPSEYNRLMRLAKDVQVLAFDELVLESLSDFGVTTVSAILRRRYSRSLPTIITTNNSVEAIHSFDIRLGSRLLGDDAVLVPLGGQDRRNPIVSTAELERRLGGS